VECSDLLSSSFAQIDHRLRMQAGRAVAKHREVGLFLQLASSVVFSACLSGANFGSSVSSSMSSNGMYWLW
jgi:hypothetical protein